jgi:hypothetical protein
MPQAAQGKDLCGLARKTCRQIDQALCDGIGERQKLDRTFRCRPLCLHVFRKGFLDEKPVLSVFVEIAQYFGRLVLDQLFDHLRDTAVKVKSKPFNASLRGNKHQAIHTLVLASQSKVPVSIAPLPFRV